MDVLMTTAINLRKEIEKILRKYLHNRADVEDTLQDVYVHLLTYNYNEIGKVEHFIYIVARNMAIDRYNYNKRRIMDEINEENEPIHNMTPEYEAETTQQIKNVSDMLSKKLTERRREIFILRKVMGYSQVEISSMLHICEGTVETTMYNATKIIRSHRP